MKYLLLTLIATAIVFFYGCKSKPASSPGLSSVDPAALEKMWKTVDSLERSGLVSSALDEVRKLKQLALSGAESGHLVKAVMYENRYLIQLEEDSALKALTRAEQEMESFPEPAKSVMHSLAAGWYTIYLQSHLWELRNRTEFGGPAGPDIRTWGIRHFTDRINQHYTKSVQWEGLKTAGVKDYLLLLTEEKNTDELRPTLYDILMHRALDFYTGAESYLTKPVYDFVLTDPKAFSPAAQFVALEFPAVDSLSSAWQALKWFQELITFRLADPSHETALLDADLKRIQYVHQQILADGKDSIYLEALRSMSGKYKGNPESALVDYYRAMQLMNEASEWRAGQDSSKRFAYNEAMDICEKAIAEFPGAYGSQLCKTLIEQIEQKLISVSVESICLPNEELLAKVDYRNLASAYLKIVRLPESPRRWRGDAWDGDEVLRRLNKLPAMKSWAQTFDSGKDHQQHITEIPLPALPVGHYALMVADDENFEGNKVTSGAVMFTVTELAYWYLDDKDTPEVAAVISRISGMPMAGVHVEFIAHEYNAGLRKQEEVKIGEGTSDSNGWVSVPSHDNKSISFRLTKGEDELYADDTYYSYRYGGQPKSDPTTLFFTDRAIYRPGQKLYFKGYALEFDQNRMPSVVPSKSVEVNLYDANGQVVSKQMFLTNVYGTFFGQFDLPQAGLTGQMSIASSHGLSRQYFHVEEYKRPKFEITFDTIRQTSRLDQEVVFRGNAKDYAGSPVSGAKAGYRVERVAMRPWWFGYYKGFWPSQEDRQVLATGQTYTRDDGSIDIAFPAKSKPGGDPALMYRFEIIVSVTDITGETHEATKSIVLNKQGYEVNIDMPERISTLRLKEVALTAKNSDGANVKVNGEVEVIGIKGPAQNKRNRLWAAPDILTISENEYAARFADYMVPGKEEMSAWPLDHVVGKRPVTVDGHGVFDFSSLISSPGYYKINWTWKDEHGNELKFSQYIMAYTPGQLLPGYEVNQADFLDRKYEPGSEVQFDFLTGLSAPPKTIRIIDRRTLPSKRIWMSLPLTGDRTIKLSEEDRGGVYVHHLTAFNNRFYKEQQLVEVPWSNKDLNVSLKTWRDKMEPGDEETWTILVAGQKQEKVTAEMVLSMYDASLDAFVPHQWQMSLYPSTIARTMVQWTQPVAANYWGLTYHWTDIYQDVPVRQYRDINEYGYYPEGGYYPMVRGGIRYKGEHDEVRMQPGAVPASADLQENGKTTNVVVADQEKKGDNDQRETGKETTTPPPLRSVLDETVFFYPQVMTDDQGRLTFSFKMKEGLTRWKFQALAHTRDLAFGLTDAEVVTQKKLMVFANPPRFFRDGDTIAFQVKASNLSEEPQAGKAQLKILDAFTDEDVSLAWGIQAAGQELRIDKQGSLPLAWILIVPTGWQRPVKYQVSASAGAFSDGEEAMLPVVTNRILITETLPLPVKASETRTFVFKSMVSNRSASTIDHQYVVEMTTSPAWYAVQALPYLMEYPYECSEQVFSRVYANTLASHIANKYPSIRQVYDAWRISGDDALVSNLEKNQELKSALLDETPWVRDAMGETQQKKAIGLLFEPNRLKHESMQSLEKLRQMQMSNGGFPWFPGGKDNWYITQYIMEGFGHLAKMGVPILSGDANDITGKAIPYLDARMIEWYDELKQLEAKGKLKMDDHQVSSMQVHYLYTRSFFPQIEHPAEIDEITNYLRTQYEKYWLQHGIFDQGLMALGSFRVWPDATISKEILASLRERTIVNEELGRYWKVNSGYQWNEAPVELQSLMIELYQDMDVPQAETDELRVWLLKQKQTTQWKSTKATSSAIYALLIHPDTWLQAVGIVQVKLGNTEVIGNSTSAEGGTGYVKKTWNGNEIKPEWSTITVSNPNPHIAWGSAYWQYWDDIDKVKSTVDENPLKVTRSLLKVNNTDRGEVTVIAPGRSLKVGDKLIVRLTIETDRAMEFVHLKDLRASGFEPMDVLSGYRWVGGLGYYQSTRDLATHFFIDYLPRGKYVIEYPVTVAQSGGYSEGLATLQCMYAPEFGGHSQGSRVLVTQN